MEMDRREFIRTSAMAAAGAMAPGYASARRLDKEADDLTLMAYYYPWYEENGPRWARNSDPDKNLYLPRIGQYDSGNPDVIAYHITQALDHGIDGFAFNWYGDLSPNGITINHSIMPILKQFPDFKFSIFYDTFIRFGIDTSNWPDFRKGKRVYDKYTKDVRKIARKYMNRPKYLRVRGRPVFTMYISRGMKRGFRDVVEATRDIVHQETGSDVYFIGDEIWWDRHNPNRPGANRMLAEHGRLVDACTAYNMAHPGIINPNGTDTHEDNMDIRRFTRLTASEYEEFARFRDEYFPRTPIVPGLMFRHNTTHVKKEGEFVPPAMDEDGEADHYEDAERVFKTMSRHFEPVEKEGRIRRALAFITSFNEWPENTSIEESMGGRDVYGFRRYRDEILRGVRDEKEQWERKQSKAA